jgi:NADPH-dependent glutamate synthase beta subunit-like oxidoreductase
MTLAVAIIGAGPAGMHKYNNQDHAMMTAMLTVENIVAGERVAL